MGVRVEVAHRVQPVAQRARLGLEQLDAPRAVTLEDDTIGKVLVRVPAAREHVLRERAEDAHLVRVRVRARVCGQGQGQGET